MVRRRTIPQQINDGLLRNLTRERTIEPIQCCPSITRRKRGESLNLKFDREVRPVGSCSAPIGYIKPPDRRERTHNTTTCAVTRYSHVRNILLVDCRLGFALHPSARFKASADSV
jgi:hypothetical protein